MTETIKKFGIPIDNSKHAGIIMPLPKYRFRVIFGSDLNVYDKHGGFFLTQFVTHAKFDSLNKRMNIGLRQSILPQQINSVFEMVQENENIFIEGLDGGNDSALFTMVLSDVKCVNHVFDFNYEESTPVMHDLTFEYSNMTARTPIDWKKRIESYFTENDFNNDPEYPSPQEVLKRYEEERKSKETNQS